MGEIPGAWRRYQELWVDAYTPPGEPPDPSNFTPRLGRMETIGVAQVLERVERDALTLCRALGYDLNTVELAVDVGVGYAI